MAFEVRYSSRAYAEYEAILDYVSEKFGSVVALKVDRHFETVIDQISINPLLYPCSNKIKNLRRCVISPQPHCITALMVIVLSWQVLGAIY